MVLKKVILKNGTIKFYEYPTNKKYNNDYYAKNRETILIKVSCGCGGSYHKLSKSTHLKSNRHKKFEAETMTNNL